MQKTKKKRYKCEKNTKFSKMQKIRGFGAYSKMSLNSLVSNLPARVSMRSCISSTTDQSIQISQKLPLEDLELLGFSFYGSISSSKVEDSKLPRSSLTKDVFGDLTGVEVS